MEIQQLELSLENIPDEYEKAQKFKEYVQGIFIENNSQEEFKRRVDAIFNETFKDDARAFVYNDQGQLFLELKKQPHIKTTSIAHIKRQSIELFMPQGDEAMAWHAFMNEIQMFLFDHPLNQDRIRRELLPSNSIWFSGGGVIPQVIQNPYRAIFSNNKKLLTSPEPIL